MPTSFLMRRAEALQITGLTDEQFSKAVAAEIIQPVHLVWQVRDARDAIIFEAGEEKAKAEADRIGGLAEPVGRAYYRRDQLKRLSNGATEASLPRAKIYPPNKGTNDDE